MGLGEIIDIPGQGSSDTRAKHFNYTHQYRHTFHTDSGAVFTLGKSYLSENHQSYFFIKNDAIRRLICGRNQSAVVCGNN